MGHTSGRQQPDDQPDDQPDNQPEPDAQPTNRRRLAVAKIDVGFTLKTAVGPTQKPEAVFTSVVDDLKAAVHTTTGTLAGAITQRIPGVTGESST